MSFFSFLKKKPDPKPKVLPLVALNEWGIFFQTHNLFIYHRFAGTLPWDSSDYMYFKTYPEITFFNGKLFGDWQFIAFNGLFLQQWHDTKATTCSLLFFDLETHTVTQVKNNLPTKNWTAQLINGQEAQFTCTGTNTTVFDININKVR